MNDAAQRSDGQGVQSLTRVDGDRSRTAAERLTRYVFIIRTIAAIAIASWALTTPGLFTRISLMSLLTSASFIGCTAIGMTLITITGNVMSLSLGATVSVCAIVFLASLKLGSLSAVVCAISAGVVISGLQGSIIGYLKANAILISIASLALILGVADVVTGSERIYAAENGGLGYLKGSFGGVPIEALTFAACLLVGQTILSFTRVGRSMFMVGSNWRAAELIGFDNGMTVTFAYVFAGGFAAVAGILLGARYGSGDMELGAGYDYTAIAAVLIGGTSIHGGAGSIFQTAFGCLVIALVQSASLLRGFGQELQYLITGLIVLGVILLQTAGKGRRA